MFRKLRQFLTPRHAAKVAQEVVRNVFRIESLEERLTPAISFSPGPTLAAGASSAMVNSADFNADGKLDLAVANLDDNSVSIFLGNGVGGFGTPTILTTGDSPVSLASGDFNGDGKLDLAVANVFDSNIRVFLGNGAGAFPTWTDRSYGQGAIALQAGDFNNDGKMDLTVADGANDAAAILLGNGDGSFGAPSLFQVGTTPVAIATGDFNGDGKLDLATANGDSNDVSVLFGNGAGGILSGLTLASGTDPSAIAASDFNGDGRLDLAVANYADDSVSIFLGTGGGNFSAATNFAVGAGPQAVVVADFDADGKKDLVVTNSDDDTISILKGTGSGAFASAGTFAVGDDPIGAAVADFNNDGKPDVATGNVDANTVSVLFNSTPDALSPTVTAITAPDVTQSKAGSTTYTFTVFYADNVAIDASTIGTDDVSITGPGGATLAITSAIISTTGNGSPKAVGYIASIPGGWSSALNGSYTISLNAGKVKDPSGNAVAAQTLASFTANLETTPPTVQSALLPNVGPANAGQSFYTFTVTYADNGGINLATLKPSNVTVVAPDGQVWGTFLSSYSWGPGNTTATANYSFVVPGNGWSLVRNGVYTVLLKANEVKDLSGNAAVPQTLGTFIVAMDQTLPTVVGVSAPNVTQANNGQTAYSFTVDYTDNVAVDAASIGMNNVTVTDASGHALSVSAAVLDAPGNNSSKRVTYTVAVPGGWSQANYGTYTVRLLGNQVKDSSGNSVTAQVLATFLAFNDQAAPTVQSLDVRNVATPNAGQTSYSFSVTYADNDAVNLATIGVGNIAVIGPDGNSLTVTAASLTGSGNTVRYSVAVPGGWSEAQNGTYSVKLLGNQVRDIAGNAAAAQTLATFTSAVDQTAPIVKTVAIGNVTSANAGQTSYTFSVTYADNIALDPLTIGVNNISVETPNGSFLNVTGAAVSVFGNGAQATVVYTVAVPGGWDGTKNGTYTLKLYGNQVWDAAGRDVVSQTLGTFSVLIDSVAPTVQSFVAPNVAYSDLGASTYSFRVAYADNVAIAASSINVNNVSIVGPGGVSLAVSAATIDVAGNGSPRTVTYTVAIPGGWNDAKNGQYSISLLNNSVKDTSGSSVAGVTLGTFSVAIGNLAPVISNYSIPGVAQSSSGSTSYSFTVTYTDDGTIDVSTIGVGNVSVTGPSGKSLTITGAVLNAPGNGQSKTVTYSAAVPGGWSDALAGTYTVKVLGNQVKDTSGKTVAAKTLGSFTVDLTPPVIKSATVPAVTAANASQTTYSFTVSFTDNVMLNIGSVGVGNVSVTGPGGQALTILSVTPNAASNGSSRNVVYTVAVPGGWNAQPAGTYAVKLLDNQVKDTAGNAVAGKTLGTLTVGADAVAPTVASFSLPNVTQANAGQTSYSFSITFADNVAINATTITPANVTVAGPGGTTMTVTGVSLNVPGNGQPHIATYTVAVPGGWDASDLGTYTVKLIGGQVKDTAGNAVASKTLGTFTVDLTPPAIKSAVAKNVTAANAGQTTYSFTISFTDNLLLSIASVSTSNVSVTGPGGHSLTVLSATPNSASNGSSRSVIYTVAIPSGWKESDNGAYSIKLLPNQIKDTAGNSIVAQTITAFSVLIPPVVAGV